MAAIKRKNYIANIKQKKNKKVIITSIPTIRITECIIEALVEHTKHRGWRINLWLRLEKKRKSSLSVFITCRSKIFSGGQKIHRRGHGQVIN